MSLARLFLPLLFICSLLFAQQGSFAHTLSHALAGQTQQHDKQAPHPLSCELCALDAQFGSALNNTFITFPLLQLPDTLWIRSTTAFAHIHALPSVARGPPATFQKIA